MAETQARQEYAAKEFVIERLRHEVAKLQALTEPNCYTPNSLTWQLTFERQAKQVENAITDYLNLKL